MKKGSKAAKAWGAKMKRLRNKKKGTRKYQVRNTARRAYVAVKKRTRRTRCVMKCVSRRRFKKKSDNWSF